MTAVNDFLAHHGVKGMKWGVRKSEYKSMSRDERKSYRKKTGKERRADLNEAYQKKASALVDVSSKHGKDVLIKARVPYDAYPVVMTGNEFLSYLSKGGAFDKRATDVFGYMDTPGGKKANALINKHAEKLWDKVDQQYVKKEKK